MPRRVRERLPRTLAPRLRGTGRASKHASRPSGREERGVQCTPILPIEAERRAHLLPTETVMTTQQRPLAVVTGASTGIGFELARCCLSNGYDLVIAAD